MNQNVNTNITYLKK